MSVIAGDVKPIFSATLDFPVALWFFSAPQGFGSYSLRLTSIGLLWTWLWALNLIFLSMANLMGAGA